MDVTHKKRGRPPLKAEEASLRPFTAQLENPTSSVAPPRSPQTGRASLHRATSSRELRPTTDLQFPGGGMAIPTGQPQRWTAVHPRAMGPSMPGTFSPRRFSVSGSPQQMAPGLVPMTAGFKPGLNPGRAPPPLQGSPTLPLVTSNSQYYQTFGPPITPYPGSPRTADRPMGPSIPRGSQEATSSGSPVRLPPIFSPTYTTGPLGHRLSDPYPTPWSLRSQDPGQRQQRPPSQGVAELVSPRTQFHPPVPQSHVGYTEPPSQPASMPSAERHPVQLPPTCPRDEHPNGEGEGDGEQRPKKRRKMALDDMVND